MTTLNPDDLKKRLETELEKINGDPRLLPEINNSNDFANPLLIGRYGYNYVCRERGQEIFRKIPFDLDELLYEVFDDLTFSIASEWELDNRKENEDSRLQLFAKQVDLMTRINKDFGKRLNDRLQRILNFGPFLKINLNCADTDVGGNLFTWNSGSNESIEFPGREQ